MEEIIKFKDISAIEAGIKIKTIRMLENRTGSEDGIHIKLFEKGKIYEVTEELANSFVIGLKEFQVAEFYVEPKKEIKKEKKMAEAPKNKSVDSDLDKFRVMHRGHKK
jgi:hypothetical protein